MAERRRPVATLTRGVVLSQATDKTSEEMATASKALRGTTSVRLLEA